MPPQAMKAPSSREWERVTLDRQVDTRFRDTLLPDAPSPREEILSRHDEELEELEELKELEGHGATPAQPEPDAEPAPAAITAFVELGGERELDVAVAALWVRPG